MDHITAFLADVIHTAPLGHSRNAGKWAPERPRSSANNSWHHYNLLSGGVKLVNALCRSPRRNAEGSRALRTLLSEYPFRFPDSGNSFEVALQNFLLIPSKTVISAPGHHP
jgi:hypothetical protein